MRFYFLTFEEIGLVGVMAIINTLNILQSTPVHVVLILAGIAFILLSIAGKFKLPNFLETAELKTAWQKGLAGSFGNLLLIAGMLTYLLPSIIHAPSLEGEVEGEVIPTVVPTTPAPSQAPSPTQIPKITTTPTPPPNCASSNQAAPTPTSGTWQRWSEVPGGNITIGSLTATYYLIGWMSSFCSQDEPGRRDRIYRVQYAST